MDWFTGEATTGALLYGHLKIDCCLRAPLDLELEHQLIRGEFFGHLSRILIYFHNVVSQSSKDEELKIL